MMTEMMVLALVGVTALDWSYDTVRKSGKFCPEKDSCNFGRRSRDSVDVNWRTRNCYCDHVCQVMIMMMMMMMIDVTGCVTRLALEWCDESLRGLSSSGWPKHPRDWWPRVFLALINDNNDNVLQTLGDCCVDASGFDPETQRENFGKSRPLIGHYF